MVELNPNMTDKKWNHHEVLSLSFSALQYIYQVDTVVSGARLSAIRHSFVNRLT